nr:hypothetical protein Iba_chr15aCG7000 [Ipomoea batatas]
MPWRKYPRRCVRMYDCPVSVLCLPNEFLEIFDFFFMVGQRETATSVLPFDYSRMLIFNTNPFGRSYCQL